MVRDYDHERMLIAVQEASLAHSTGNLPVGAALYIDGELQGARHNQNLSSDKLSNHAEVLLLDEFSSQIKRAFKHNKRSEETRLVELYSSWEPCMFCMGSAMLHRVHRVVYAARDPQGGYAAHFLATPQPHWYEKKKPEIVSGILEGESASMLLEHMLREGWSDEHVDGMHTILRNAQWPAFPHKHSQNSQE